MDTPRRILPLETRYAGCRFRSRHEARWAVVFDHLGIHWEYEPQGYLVPGHDKPYLPDFYLPEHGLHLEVKPTYADRIDPDAIRLWTDFAAQVATVWTRDRTAMLVGPIPDPATVDHAGPPRADDWYDPGIVILGDWHYAWCACPTGQHVDIQYEARGGRIHCGCPRHLDDRHQTGDHPRLLAAYAAGRAARFEHGQAPTPPRSVRFMHPVI